MTLSTTFIETKNKQVNEPRWLYEIETDSATLFLTNGPANITFNGQEYKGKPVGDSVPGGPIWHEGLNENLNGRMDTVRVGVGNSDQIFQAYLESENGLRGKSVVIRMVFADDLSNAESQLYWQFTINASGAISTTIVFDLVWANDPLSRMAPTELFNKTSFPSAPASKEVIL